MPLARRNEPLHVQIHDHYAALIAGGELRPGDRLPTMQQIGADWGVSHQTAVRAVEWLKSAGLVTTSREGTTVTDPRLVIGPQQRIAAVKFPDSENVEVTDARMAPCPDYVVPILGLDPHGPGGVGWVIRREQVSYEQGGTPFMLAVSWFPPALADEVPELLHQVPIDNPGGAVRLIEARTGRRVTHGRQAREARQIKDDGREGPLLRLDPGASVLAEVYVWMDAADVVEYGEFVLIQNRVTENAFTVDG
jgi:GntR family transcriptional regulator